MPSKFLQPLFFLLAKASHSAMAQQVEHLKTENEILRRRLPKHIRTTPSERRRLIRTGRPLGATLKHLITIVAYSTFLGWLREENKFGKRQSNGRPRTKESVIEIILRMARENHWGYRRIYAELCKISIRSVSPTTVKHILIAHGFDPCPIRPGGSWADFIKRHAETLWACDFLSKRILTKTGFVDCFVLFFIHVASRRVHIAGVTTCPSNAWMAQQARNLCMHFEEQSSKPVLLLHDRDGKFTPQFKNILASEGHHLNMLPIRSPNLNAYAERWVQSLRRECLDHFMVFGEDHMRHLVHTYTDYYNSVRPHQGMGNKPLGSPRPSPRTFPPKPGQVKCRTWLGGLLRHYYSEAA